MYILQVYVLFPGSRARMVRPSGCAARYWRFGGATGQKRAHDGAHGEHARLIRLLLCCASEQAAAAAASGGKKRTASRNLLQ